MTEFFLNFKVLVWIYRENLFFVDVDCGGLVLIYLFIIVIIV